MDSRYSEIERRPISSSTSSHVDRTFGVLGNGSTNVDDSRSRPAESNADPVGEVLGSHRFEQYQFVVDADEASSRLSVSNARFPHPGTDVPFDLPAGVVPTVRAPVHEFVVALSYHEQFTSRAVPPSVVGVFGPTIATRLSVLNTNLSSIGCTFESINTRFRDYLDSMSVMVRESSRRLRRPLTIDLPPNAVTSDTVRGRHDSSLSPVETYRTR